MVEVEHGKNARKRSVQLVRAPGRAEGLAGRNLVGLETEVGLLPSGRRLREGDVGRDGETMGRCEQGGGDHDEKNERLELTK